MGGTSSSQLHSIQSLLFLSYDDDVEEISFYSPISIVKFECSLDKNQSLAVGEKMKGLKIEPIVLEENSAMYMWTLSAM